MSGGITPPPGVCREGAFWTNIQCKLLAGERLCFTMPETVVLLQPHTRLHVHTSVQQSRLPFFLPLSIAYDGHMLEAVPSQQPKLLSTCCANICTQCHCNSQNYSQHVVQTCAQCHCNRQTTFNMLCETCSSAAATAKTTLHMLCTHARSATVTAKLL